jgi:hypothetical protein
MVVPKTTARVDPTSWLRPGQAGATALAFLTIEASDHSMVPSRPMESWFALHTRDVASVSALAATDQEVA